jgi:hypothetical protein
LYDAWAGGQIPDCERRPLTPGTWLSVDWPERVIGAGKRVRLFRAAGFLSIPGGLSRPDSAMTVFRGATADRRTGMSWTMDVRRAGQFCQRHSWHAPAATYRTAAAPDAVLALLERRARGRRRSSRTRGCSLLGTGRTASPAALPPRRMTTLRARLKFHSCWNNGACCLIRSASDLIAESALKNWQVSVLRSAPISVITVRSK